MKVKYPRTPHLDNSPGSSSDDVLFNSSFENQKVVVTLKMDGENTSLYNNYSHARSLDSRNHPSRNWIKNFHAKFKNDIPNNFRICGENLFAFHSIFYTNLPSYFMVFNIWDQQNICLPWNQTVEYCSLLGLHTTPVIYVGPYPNNLHQIYQNYQTNIKTFQDHTQQIPTSHEGYVIRYYQSFHFNDFSKYNAKWVRKNHIQQPNSHWMSSKIIPNQLKAP